VAVQDFSLLISLSLSLSLSLSPSSHWKSARNAGHTGEVAGDRVPTIAQQVLPGDVRGVVARQEQDRGRHLIVNLGEM
jgi:hypothetical protein